MSSISKDYVFTQQNNELQFIGDFDGLYANDNNPWGQDGSDERLGEYYKYSRDYMLEKIQDYTDHKSMLEVGCGLGHVVNYFNKNSEFVCDGADISSIAIKKAKIKFPNYNFFNFDVQASNIDIKLKYDVIVLNQVLWYVLENIDNVFNNILNLLTINTTSNGSLFIISNAFMQYQGYGRDMIDGFGGLIQYIESEQGENFKIVDASLTHKDNMLYKNGCVVMKKING